MNCPGLYHCPEAGTNGDVLADFERGIDDLKSQTIVN